VKGVDPKDTDCAGHLDLLRCPREDSINSMADSPAINNFFLATQHAGAVVMLNHPAFDELEVRFHERVDSFLNVLPGNLGRGFPDLHVFLLWPTALISYL